MGLFDKMFGDRASVAESEPNNNQLFDQLKGKYSSVLRMMEQQGVRLQNVHIENNKLYVRGAVGSQEAKNRIWDQIKLVDPNYSDLTADLTVDPSAAPVGSQTGGSTAGTQQQGGQRYTVQAGDTLSKLARQFYGDASQYMRIFEANRDQLNDPNMIKVGQVLTIPPQ